MDSDKVCNKTAPSMSNLTTHLCSHVSASNAKVLIYLPITYLFVVAVRSKTLSLLKRRMRQGFQTEESLDSARVHAPQSQPASPLIF